MKNGLIIFLFILPLSLLNDFYFERNNEILAVLELIIPFVVLRFILNKSYQQYPKKTVLMSIFKTSLISGLFFAIWIGFYQYLIAHFFKPEILETQMEILKSMDILGKKFTDDEISQQFQLLQSPFYWIISALFLYSILFSILGFIFGYLYQLKVKQQ